MLANDSLYHEQTVFDQLVSWSKQRCAQALPADREQRWGGLFVGFSLLLSIFMVYFMISAAYAGSSSSAGANVISAVLMVFAVRFFLLTGQQMLAPTQTVTVSIPASASPAQQTLRSEPVTNKPVQARQFFKAVRDAGINVKIARALYSGGIKCAEDLNDKSDAELLAIRGVGPATVRKLRSHFNFVEEYYEV